MVQYCGNKRKKREGSRGKEGYRGLLRDIEGYIGEWRV